ncbi:MAG: DUF488 domain-containing protein [Sideroxydans sp.]
MLKLKRVYEAADPNDGFRVLVDRLWPRGLTKEKAHIDLWLKEVAPSDELRKWFGHEPDKWPVFSRAVLQGTQISRRRDWAASQLDRQRPGDPGVWR